MSMTAGQPFTRTHRSGSRYSRFSATCAIAVGKLSLARHISLFLQGRSLQQSSPACSLSVGSNTLDFAACKSLQTALSADYQLLYTVTTPAGQPGPVLHGAIDAASPGQLCLNRLFGVKVSPLLTRPKAWRVLRDAPQLNSV